MLQRSAPGVGAGAGATGSGAAGASGAAGMGHVSAAAMTSQEELSRKIRVVQAEVDKLADKIKKEKEKYQKTNSAALATSTQFKVCRWSGGTRTM